MATRTIVVEGNVQGVGFRWYVARLAEAFGVSGEVWNRGDGKVEMVAHHLDPTRLATFEDALWLGPGEVERVCGSNCTDPVPSGIFRIRRD